MPILVNRFFKPPIMMAFILAAQAVTNLFWLPISAHSGQTTIPWMMNHGKVLFGDILEQHAPATSVIAALAQRLLPLPPDITVRLLHVVLILAITLLTYQLTRQMFNGDKWAGLIAALIWAWWSPVYGNVLFYFNTLLVFCILLALVIWMAGNNQEQWFTPVLAGLFTGAATLAKQQGWVAVAFWGLWLLIYHRRVRDLILYAVGVLALPAATLIIVYLQGNLSNYLFWNWTFNLSSYMDAIPMDSNFFRKLLLSDVLVVPFAIMMLSRAASRKNAVLVLLLYAAMLLLLYPRSGEIAAISHVPFVALMSGVVLSIVGRQLQRERSWLAQPGHATLVGLTAVLAAGWIWTGIVMYVPTPLGIGGTPAYDEFKELADAIVPFKNQHDTLFVLPETDSTPQLHPMTGMLPPGTWIKGWNWYFEPPGVLDKLLAEWTSAPPTFVIVFPTLVKDGQPGINRLLDVVATDYEKILQVDEVLWHGPAIIYRHLETLSAYHSVRHPAPRRP